MTKVTERDKLAALDNVIYLIEDYVSKFMDTDNPNGVYIEMQRIQARLTKRYDNLLNPQPRKPKQTPAVQEYEALTRPRTAGTVIQIAGKTKGAKERRGRINQDVRKVIQAIETHDDEFFAALREMNTEDKDTEA